MKGQQDIFNYGLGRYKDKTLLSRFTFENYFQDLLTNNRVSRVPII